MTRQCRPVGQLPQREDVDDAAVAHVRHLRLGEEPLGLLGVPSQLGPQHLDGHRPADDRLDGPVDHALAARPQPLGDDVVAHLLPDERVVVALDRGRPRPRRHVRGREGRDVRWLSVAHGAAA
jgi:hypothetical protein